MTEERLKEIEAIRESVSVGSPADIRNLCLACVELIAEVRRSRALAKLILTSLPKGYTAIARKAAEQIVTDSESAKLLRKRLGFKELSEEKQRRNLNENLDDFD